MSTTNDNFVTVLLPESRKSGSPLVAPTVPKVCEESLARGRFGWSQLASDFVVPFIFRQGEVKITSCRMVNKILFAQSSPNMKLPSAVASCADVFTFAPNDDEAKLLNEINEKHCNHIFGREKFTTKDRLVGMEEVENLQNFLSFSHAKVISKTATSRGGRCGFTRIRCKDDISDVPYVNIDGNKYFPIFYFEGDIERLEEEAEVIGGWHLTYLKLCFKIQGLLESLVPADSCQVVSMKVIQKYFPLETKYEEFWPNKDFLRSFDTNAASKKIANVFPWMKKTGADIPKSVPGAKLKQSFLKKCKFDKLKMTKIKDFPSDAADGPAYKRYLALIDGKKVPAVNVRPGQTKDLLALLPDLVTSFAPTSAHSDTLPEEVGNMLLKLGVLIYRGNAGQKNLLEGDSGEIIPLVLMRDVLKYLRNIKSHTGSE